MSEPSLDLLSRLIVDHVCDGIVLTDAKGSVQWINPAFSRLSGYSLEDLQGKQPGPILQGPTTSDDSKAQLAQAIRTRTACRVDIVNYSKTGEAYISQINLSPIFDDTGTLTNFVAVQRDVTEERALEQESTDFKAYQRALEQQAIVSVTDARGKITFVNKKFIEISGFSTEELVGRTHQIVNSGYHERSFFRAMWAQIVQGETWHGEVCNRAKDGALYWVDTTVVPVHDKHGKISRYVSTRYDITKRKEAEFELIRMAETDAMTGLANRVRFGLDLKSALLEAHDEEGDAGGLLLMIDLDHFKDLNDSMGHHCGDLMLKETARRLVEFVGDHGIVARLGGDEFAAIVSTVHIPDVAEFAKALQAAACAPVSLDGVIYMPSFSMGIARFPEDGKTPEGLQINADMALYEAKRNGRKTWRLFDPLVRHHRDVRNTIRAIVTEALKKDLFDIALQPICCAQTHRHEGFEVLARLSYDGQPVAPDKFIPVAEQYGLIPEIGHAIMDKAFAAFRTMADHGLNPGRLAINFAAQQLREPGLVETVMDLAFAHGIAPSDLVIEITETALIGRSTEVVAKVLQKLRAQGARVALDDFGTGFSSLAHLRDFAVDRIKIDKSFVMELETNPGDQALVRGLIELALCLDLEITAEGVETEEQRALIAGCGCHYIQGFLHARPMPLDEAMAFLQAQPGALGVSRQQRQVGQT